MAIENKLANHLEGQVPVIETPLEGEKNTDSLLVKAKEKPAKNNSQEEKNQQPPASQAISSSKSPVAEDYLLKRAKEIDQILSRGLEEIYLKMPPAEQSAFRIKGEETVTKINVLLSETKIKVNKIIDLIRDWLKMIPGVNRFFLEQEAKIKADDIIKAKNRF
jgi:hypothetical protein